MQNVVRIIKSPGATALAIAFSERSFSGPNSKRYDEVSQMLVMERRTQRQCSRCRGALGRMEYAVSALFLACVGWIAFGTITTYAAPLTFSTTIVSLASPAVDLTITSGSTADSLTVNATSVMVSLSASGGNSFTLTSAQSDLLVSASAGGGTCPITCLGAGSTGVSGVDEVILTQQSGSATYTITPGGTSCMTINNSVGGITIYPIAIHAPSYASTTVGNALVIPVTVSDPNGYSPAVSATLPDDATFSTSTMQLTWTPEASGTARATILASDKLTQSSVAITLEAFGPAAVSSSGTQATSTVSATSSPSIDALKAEIAALEQEVQQLVAELKSRGLTPAIQSSAYAFARNLTMGSRGNDVHALQLFLVGEDAGPAARALRTHGTTSYFGPLTRSALAEYQKKVGINPPAGYFGPITRKYINSL
jgi:hypothetical protein